MGKSKTSTYQLSCEEEEGDTEEESHSISGIHAMNQSNTCKMWVDVLLNGKPIKMELDTGASLSLVNDKVSTFSGACIYMCTLHAYSGYASTSPQLEELNK